jgi:hypothetical protein
MILCKPSQRIDDADNPYKAVVSKTPSMNTQVIPTNTGAVGLQRSRLPASTVFGLSHITYGMKQVSLHHSGLLSRHSAAIGGRPPR